MFLLVYNVLQLCEVQVYQLLFYLLHLATLTVYTKDNLKFDVLGERLSLKNQWT